MSEREYSTVGADGQLVIPERFRDRLDIHAGDTVAVRENDGQILIEKAASRQRLAEGYRESANRARELDGELTEISREADEFLGDAPDT